MASTVSQKMQELKRIIRLHANWLVYATLGESALTKSEVKELEAYGKLPMGKALDLVDKSYLLGRLRATLRRSEYKQVSYEELNEEVDSTELSPLEELVIEQARLRAGTALKGLANEVTAGTLNALQQAMGDSISEALVKQTVATETVLALTYKRSAQQLASELASKLQSSQKRNWLAVARTELHSAKVQGAAQAIINKVDIYSNSDGIDSDVSVVPASVCCDDCRKHYIGADGNPKIFKLSTLLGAGSNADGDVSHKREGKLHVHWKTTLPPLHPNCGCQLQYIPSGYGWNHGKLELLNKSLFEANLIKATAGVQGGISPTVKPTGPKGNTPTSPKSPGMPSLPGAAAPGNAAGPGRPAGSLPKPGSGTPGGSGGGPQYAPCPFGGGAECISHGGNGAKLHKPNGSIMKKHQEAMARGAKPVTPQAKEEQRKQLDATAKNYNAQPHPHQVVIDHLAEGEIGQMKKLGGKDAGQNPSFKVTIVGNGSGLMKPPIAMDDYVDKVSIAGGRRPPTDPAERKKFADSLQAPGAGTITPGMNPKCEAGAYQHGKTLGIAVPVTTLRAHDGSDGGPRGMTSVMHWQDKAVDVGTYTGDHAPDNEYENLMKSTPKEHQDKIHEQLSEIAVADIIWNNGDRHWGNLMMDPDNHNVVPIDHGTAFSNGLAGSRNEIAHHMTKAGVALQVSPRLQQKLKNMSLEDTMRSLDEAGLPDHMKAQTFLRQKYVSYLQDTFDHIPFDRIRGTALNNNGEGRGYDDHWQDGNVPGLMAYFTAEMQNKTPNQQFEGWAKAYMTQAAGDPSHPDHADAKRLMEIQPLRSSAHVMGREEATKESLQKHFDSIHDYDMEVDKLAAPRIKGEMPKARKFSSEVSQRQAPEMPAVTPASTEDKGTVAKPGAKKQSSIALADEDLQEISPDEIDAEELSPEDVEVLEDQKGKVSFEGGQVRTGKEKVESKEAYGGTNIHLNLSEFEDKNAPEDDSDIDEAFDRIQTKKSLFLSDPNAKFPLDMILRK